MKNRERDGKEKTTNYRTKDRHRLSSHLCRQLMQPLENYSAALNVKCERFDECRNELETSMS